VIFALDIRRATLVVALVVALLPLCGTRAALAQEETAEPQLAASAWALTDVRSGEYLAGGNPDERLPMASTTKIMLALVAFEEADLDEEVTVSEDAAAFATPAYSNVGLYPGDVLSVRELLMATLISSGDDAAYALAEHLGGEGGVDAFVARMNEEAAARGLDDTRFENPVGFDAEGHYSSARDLAEMTRLATSHPEFGEMVGTTYASITTQDREIPLTNTNELLFTYAPATGVKTGTTPAAGPSLVASAASGNESYISVVLDDVDRFNNAIRLLEYGFAAHDRRDLIVEGERYARADVPYRRGETVPLVAEKSVAGLVDGDSNVERAVRVMEELPRSARPGTRLGEIVVDVDGEKVGETALVAGEGYEKASIGERVWYTASGLWKEP
jgi:serine-type D-Ala-D-Ala carboxypeptidase (penicillin-binding protein 5/6)